MATKSLTTITCDFCGELISSSTEDTRPDPNATHLHMTGPYWHTDQRLDMCHPCASDLAEILEKKLWKRQEEMGG